MLFFRLAALTVMNADALVQVIPAIRSRCLGIRVPAPTHEEVSPYRGLKRVPVPYDMCVHDGGAFHETR